MTTDLEDFFLADDLEAAGLPQTADWVRTHSHEEVDRERSGLLGALEPEEREETSPVRHVLECQRCGHTVPLDHSGSWRYETDGSLACPGCSHSTES